MAYRPGVGFTESTAPATRGVPTDISTAFVVGVTQRGPIDSAVALSSIGDYVRYYGDRITTGPVYDALDVFFREGGTRAYVGRVVGPTAAAATVNVPGSSGTSIVATAKAPGTWYNGLTVKAVSASGGYRLEIYSGSTLLASSATLALNSDAPTFINNYIAFTAGGGSTTPTTGSTTYALTGGTDGSTITQTQKNTALALFTKSYGPGKVLAPGDTAAAMHAAMSVHAEANNRLAYVDLPDTPTVGTITSAAATNSALADADRVAQFAGSVVVPYTGGVTRTVSLAAAAAGLEARKNRIGNVGAVAAFDAFPFSYVSSFSQNFSDADVETLVLAGVNVGKNEYGLLELFGYTTALPRTNDTYWMLNAANIRMAIRARGERICHSFLGQVISNQTTSLGALEGALKGMLLEFFNDGNLFSETNTPSEAFQVIVDASNNPTEQLALGNVNASLNVRIAPYVEFVNIDLVTTPITQSLGS